MVTMDIILGDALFKALVCGTGSPQLAHLIIHDITRRMSISEFFHRFNLYDIVEPASDCYLRRMGIPVLVVSNVNFKALANEIIDLVDRLNLYADNLRHGRIDIDKVYKWYS